MLALGSVSLLALTAYADAIQSWRTPNGSLYFGDHPPPGSTLLTTYADSPRESAIDTPSAAADLAREAAQGREIIRRRDEQRMAERQRELEEEERQQAAYLEPGYGYYEPYWIVGTSVPCTVGVDCIDHGHHHGDRGDHHHSHIHDPGFLQRAQGKHGPPPQARVGGGAMRPAPAPPVVRVAPAPAAPRLGGGPVTPFRR